MNSSIHSAEGPALIDHCSSELRDLPENLAHPSISKIKADIVIIGGGACGVAVAVQLIERIQNGHNINSIALIEKKESVGQGLAYSLSCPGSILNMNSETMGLFHNTPKHFFEWVRNCAPELQNVGFPERTQYGTYLGELLNAVVENAKNLGVKFEIVSGDAVDIHRSAENLEVVLKGGEVIHTRDVVLAVGNFCAAIYKQFKEFPGYFQCPWPAEKLRAIPEIASVAILGARLTAVDVANFLIENGHKGPITFVSRSGRLAKVQGPDAVFSRRFEIYSLAKEVEQDPTDAFNKVLSHLQKYIEIYQGKSNFEDLSAPCDPIQTLKSDIDNAEAGQVAWQSVLKCTKTLLERFWHCFTDADKQLFLQKYDSTWVTYRHSIPLENARKILAYLESGQLQVLRGSRITRENDKFLVQSESGISDVKSDFLIEALGQETTVSRLDSPLLKNILGSGLIKAHRIKGIDVDFDTLKAADGIHLLGSLTKGVHFYTTAVDRNAAHAARVADNLVGLHVRRPLHIAFFIGSDLFSHLMLSKLVHQLLALGHMPFIFQPLDKVNADAIPKPFEIEELGFFERTLLQEHIIPFLGTSIAANAKHQTVIQLKTAHGLLIQYPASINSLDTLETLTRNHIDIGISLRCYQRFGPRIIKYFSSPDKFLLNLHPGKLPQYRGVSTAIRAMMNGDKKFGYSLHHVNEVFDAGDVIDVRMGELDYGKTVLGNMEGVWEVGVDMILDAVEKFSRGGDLQAGKTLQNESEVGYFTFPTKEELEVCCKNGIKLVDREQIMEFLVESFAGDGVGSRKMLRGVIEAAAKDWSQSKDVAKD